MKAVGRSSAAIVTGTPGGSCGTICGEVNTGQGAEHQPGAAALDDDGAQAQRGFGRLSHNNDYGKFCAQFNYINDLEDARYFSCALGA